ncbi:MAG: calcium-binding protein [Tateyamaria sp.]|uniref:calcium-binding protein n=1 Tax=Tateyamaria sp. TaxID=1929288 RepID=UPI00329F87D8
MDNLLQETGDKLTFDQYAVSEHWVGEVEVDGTPVLSTTVETVQDVTYELDFNLAANLAADVQNVTVEVFYNGKTIGNFYHEGGVFETYTFEFLGTGEVSQLEFKITDVNAGADSAIDTSGVIPSYLSQMTFLGEEVTVSAFAPGQNFIYQVLNGQLVKFDLETNSYTEAETPDAVNVNAIGYSAEHDLIYGIARSNGVDAVGNTISRNDVIAMDATGATFAVSPGIMGSYIGDVDDQGNLWTFNGGLSRAVVYDLSEANLDGALASRTIDLAPIGMSTAGLADLAYHAATQTFFGIAHGGSTGLPGTLVAIDISEVSLGGEPIVTTQTIAGTIVNGEVKSGIPSGAFGATIVDADGNVYVGANNTDHDLDGSTGQAGGFYKIVTDADGDLQMELLAEAPKVSSNDGAMDTRGVDPFLGIDTSSTVLIRAPEVTVAIAEDDIVQLAAKGEQTIIDLLANDKVTDGDTLVLTHLNGVEVAALGTLTLQNGEIVTYLGDGRVAVTPGQLPRDVSAELTYSISNSSGVTDTAVLKIDTSPVQGGIDADHMVGFTDADGTQIDGSDGLNDVILGYGGRDKIFSGLGDDDIYGGAGNDFIRAQDGDDVIYGEADNDVLDGGAGADQMFGGTGNDIYFVDNAADVVSEEGGSGTDTVKSKVDFTLGSGLENLWLDKNSAASTGTGNELRNMIVGNKNDNLIDGQAGNDNLMGGAGNDIIFGGEGHDKLHGNDGVDELYGGAGNDKLHGGLGDDVVFGGDGDDVLCPGEGDDVMYGGAGRDLLSGNAGADIAYGGAGDDTYKVSDAFDTVIEYAGEGYDVVHASADFALSENVEELVFFGDGGFTGVGSTGDNRITGNIGNDTLSGAEGDDHINGMFGDDILRGDAGSDRLFGNDGNDVIFGGDGADVLSGGEGADILKGGAGNDSLYGDAGADVFEFRLNDGQDEVRKFDILEDTVWLGGISEGETSWLEVGRGLRLDYGEADSILFCGLTSEQAEAIDLVFL